MIGYHEREVHDFYLKRYAVFYLSNMWWDLIPDADCSGVEREHCSVAPGGYVMAIVNTDSSQISLNVQSSEYYIHN